MGPAPGYDSSNALPAGTSLSQPKYMIAVSDIRRTRLDIDALLACNVADRRSAARGD
jgi:hypothetical protein